MRSDAAIILWDPPTLISADTDVSTTGTLLYAFTLGNLGLSSATLNGVTFDGFAVPNGSAFLASGTSVALAPLSGIFNSTLTGAGSTSSPFSSLTPACQGLLQSAFSKNAGGMAGGTGMLLAGLTIGNSYQVQFWANASGLSFRNPPSSGAKTTLTAGNTVTLDLNSTNADGGVGQWVIGHLHGRLVLAVVPHRQRGGYTHAEWIPSANRAGTREHRPAGPRSSPPRQPPAPECVNACLPAAHFHRFACRYPYPEIHRYY